MAWNLSGTYFESCNCEAACPCVFLGPPSTGECTALVGWHIDDGEYEGQQLGGLNVAFGIAGAGIAFSLQEVIASTAGWVAITFGNFFLSFHFSLKLLNSSSTVNKFLFSSKEWMTF